MKKIIWSIRIPAELLAEQIMYYPGILVTLACVISNFSVSSVFLLLSAILTAILIHYAILLGCEKEIDGQLISTFRTFSNYRFTPVDLREIVERYASYDEIQSQLYQNNLTELGQALSAQCLDSSKKGFSGFKAFPRFFSSNIVILPEGAENYNYFQQFQLFHELGHLGKASKKIVAFRGHIFAGLLVILLLCITVFPWYISLALILPVRIWHGSCLGLSLIYGQEGKECEKMADSFAVKTMLAHPDFPKIEQMMNRVNSDFSKRWKESFEYYVKWFQDPVDMQGARNLLSKYVKSSKLKSAVQDGLSDNAVNYNSMLENECFPRNYFTAYLLCGLLAAGTVLGRIDGWCFWVLLILPLAVSVKRCFSNFYGAVKLNCIINMLMDGEDLDLNQLDKTEKGRHFWKKVKNNIGNSLASDKGNRGFILRQKRR